MAEAIALNERHSTHRSWRLASMQHVHNTAIATTDSEAVVTTFELEGARQGGLPVWIRAPRCGGPEHYTGFTRSKLYELEGMGKIRSVSIREPGKLKGTRLFHLGSILDFIDRCEASPLIGATEGVVA